jgi:hypothetical protein
MDNPTFESLIRWEPPAVADEAKGNAAFSAGCFEEAARHFTDAIALPLATTSSTVLLQPVGGARIGCIKDCHKAVERGRELLVLISR